MARAETKSAFPPLEPKRARILILGSLPGDRSIALQQYYGHPRNRFWPLLAELLGTELPEDYDERCGLLGRHAVAVWDVAETAVRPGSLDADITAPQPHDLPDFIRRHPELEVIAFNGQKAAKLYDVFFPRFPQLRYFDLPSTSPANARFRLNDLISAWSVAF
jgi:hypoxanthine-DNA glycosylase